MSKTFLRACPLLIQSEPVKIDSYFLPTRNISRSYTSTEVNHSPLYISASFNEFYSMISPVGNIQVLHSYTSVLEITSISTQVI